MTNFPIKIEWFPWYFELTQILLTTQNTLANLILQQNTYLAMLIDIKMMKNFRELKSSLKKSHIDN